MQFNYKNKTARILLPLLAAFLIIAALYYQQQGDPYTENKVFEERFGPVMGTSGYVKILPTSSLKIPVQEAFSNAYARLKHTEKLLSSFIPESDISRINRAKAGEKIRVDPLTWRVLLESRRFYQLSNGAFDPAIGELIAIYPWTEKEIPSLPSPETIKEALAHSGFDKLEFIREGMYVVKKDAKLSVDLGGIAKGLGVSIMAAALQDQGVECAIIEIGGEITLIGSPNTTTKSSQTIGTGQKVWTTGIKHPRNSGIIRRLEATSGKSIATSGDYEKYFLVAGKRYSHIINPATGLPTTGGVISATIVTSRSCTIADALATAVSVLKIEQAKELLRLFPETEAYLILSDLSEVILKGGLDDAADPDNEAPAK